MLAPSAGCAKVQQVQQTEVVSSGCSSREEPNYEPVETN